MNKTSLIIKREYLTRVKKKSFILMTVLGPILFAGFFAAIVLLAMPKEENYNILVVDETTLMYEGMELILNKEKAKIIRDNKAREAENKVNENGFLQFREAKSSYASAIIEFQKEEGKYDYLVYLPPNLIDQADNKANLIYKKAPNSPTETKIISLINEAREALLMEKEGVDKAKYDKIKTKVGLTPIASTNLDENGNPIEKQS